MKIASLLSHSLAVICFTALPALSDVEVRQQGPTHTQITISGTITANDAVAIEKLDLSRQTVMVLLNSRGGDVHAAMWIGRILRKHEAGTFIVAGEGLCFSSCALIYVAGVIRHGSGSGTIGLHRPYLVEPGANPDAVRRATRVMFDSVKEYLEEMGVSPTVYDLMMRTEPERMLTYRGMDEISLLIPSGDPIHGEISLSYFARWFGISSAEYRRRQAEAEATCKGGKPECWIAVQWGLSEGVYTAKAQLARKCHLDEEVLSLPFRVHRDHPNMEAWYACQREIMYAR